MSSKNKNPLNKLPVSEVKPYKLNQTYGPSTILVKDDKGNTANNSEECPLLNLGLPPVTEMEHSIKSCFCYMCKCGKHKCPGEYRLQTKSHSNHFKTNYKLYFRKHVRLDFKINKPEDHNSKVSFPSEGKSTSQLAYIPHSIDQVEKILPENRVVTPYKFRGSSVYHSEYPNWGVRETEQPILQGHKYKPNDLKSSMKSQYQEAFHNTSSKDKLEFKELAKNFKNRNWNSNGILSPSNEFIGECKILKDYPALPVISKPRCEKNMEDSIGSKEKWNGQFVSTYNGSYQRSTPLKYFRKRELNSFS